MLSEQLISDVAVYIKNRIKTAEVVFEGKKPEPAQIINKEITNDVLKVFVNTTKGKGTIEDVRLLDDKGQVLISKPRGVVKTIDHAIISTFWIRVLEEELANPVNIFEIKEGLDG